MNKGVEILLERMKSNPEEFDGNGRDSKWENLVYRFSDWLDEEDKQAFRNAIKQCRQEQFTAKVMEELLDPKSKDGVTLTSISHPSAMPLGGATQTGYTLTSNGIGSPWVTGGGGGGGGGSTTTQATLTLGQTPINEQELQHMKLHLTYQQKMMELQAKAMEAEKQKKVSLLERLLKNERK